ncbi:hypothetical protein O6H91_13G091500 [Diphasiastrum complanatum]|uniref:Uncharacterized protein n=7 Tax=Diphasiastrum complanatum TaxID=34168 RepID=A0ACC2BXF1_DIPCM|nr:hypothetical protein O6H91_13G091500 [Diphasiastrum complanatum]KAJ7534375.1 hypothetical protein O6H91_13G091500 [Diphasiastrum complanatum]KAJ7534376.1 hypothetical protein O6H91_13G091500 [Diphasiastrum complanatum]KAJ7534377.1 hypothetical protein O6H91_13G091500 [Diphasiastrum complanatum]KAJ7534379.1 hypothetical protein O6H91_13G091500 [Diphasiastrum complanatum]
MGGSRSGRVRGRPQPSYKGKSDTNMGHLEDDMDLFHKRRDKIPLSFENPDSDDDEEQEDPVFNLEGEESDQSEDKDSDDDELNEEELTGLSAKIAKQAKILRQKTGTFDEDDDEPEEDEKEKRAWGKGKKIYYNAENVDFELQSSDEEAPAEEEAEVRRLQQKMAASLRPEDFEQDEDDADQEEFEKGEETLEEMAKRHLDGEDRISKTVPLIESGIDKIGNDVEAVAIEQVRKDYSLLTKDEQMQVVMSDAPELVGLLAELREALDELKNKVQPLLEKVKGGHYATKDGISYLEVKHLLLLSYCQTIVFYLLLKAEGRSVRDHPVISRLVEIRMLIEKIRPIDKKLHYQIEKLLKSASEPSNDEKDAVFAGEQEGALNYRPNPDMLVSKLGESAEESGGIYRPPMIAPTAMQGDENSKDRKSRARAEKEQQRRASRSAFVKELANDLEGRPEEVGEFIGLESREMLKERAKLEARAKQEEDLFTRVPLSKAERHKLKHLKRSRNGLLGMLDDFDDDVADLAGIEDERQAKVPSGPPADLLKPRKLSQLIMEASHPSKRPKVDSGDADLPVRADIGERRRKHESRRSFATNASDEEPEDGIETKPVEDEFYQEVKELRASKQAEKAAKYSRNLVLPVEEADADGKRHITYQMEKNRGLTPHRKKMTKNPRKKYKVKHDKAVIRRKGQVREIKRPEGPYAGESTGIKANISRSIRFKG